MHVVGIIAEFNPLHLGHVHLLNQVRQNGADAVVVALSGGVMQRGAFPMFSAGLRTRAALLSGADLVLEIPAPYALQSAEGYARAGVGLLQGLGVVNALAFGTQGQHSGQELMHAAQLASTSSAELKTFLQAGLPYHTAKTKALATLAPELAALGIGGNNILALEYARAVLAGGGMLKLAPVPRVGPVHGAPVPGGGYASASFLRGEAAKGALASFAQYTPQALAPLYEQALSQGEYFTPGARFDALVLGRLRAMDPATLKNASGVGEGLEHALLTAARASTTVNEMLLAAKSKRYPYTRLARCTIAAVLGYNKIEKPVPYIHVLGANKTGFALLRKAKETASLPVSHALATLAKGSPHAAKVALQSAAAADVFSVLQQTPAQGGTAYTDPLITL
ncbi:nucleotidyltransferase family protein [Ruminococcaceae bacterium OttesenSCG-928-N02]|nr:nucleotidyltransferase family protein [Ruminococcaceae bacterium OttesenSCG-928-N02]